VVADDRYRPVPAGTAGGRPITDDALRAGRWLRDHSAPDDVVATNAHCRTVAGGQCDVRHFWIAAYTERRVLVEGWGYTEYALGGGSNWSASFPDARRLAENDRAFQEPSAEALDVLRRRYGVRWLFVDRRYEPASPRLGEFATERYRSEDFLVYELRGWAYPAASTR
jgi:hypothetical protein